MEKKLKKISKQLKGASKLHAGQAKKIDNMIKNKSSALKMKKNKKTAPKIEGGSVYADTRLAQKLRAKKIAGLKKKKSPTLAKLSASCKAAAKRKFKVYPSAYANMWAAKTQRQGKC